MAEDYKVRPSSLLGLTDVYLSFCFDEACLFIKTKIKDGEKPTYKVEYKSFTDLYKNYK